MSLRFLPIAIFVAVLMLGIKVGNLLFGLEGTSVTASHAQQAAPSGPEASASGQTTDGAGQAQAGTPADGANTDEGKKRSTAARKPGTRSSSGLPSDPTLFTQAEIDLLQKLAKRRDELEHWSKDLTMREQLLKATEKRIDKKLVELRSIQSKVKTMLKQYDKEQEDRLKSLVKIYENMKPRDAARIFMELDMPILLDVVERMRERKAAPIFAKMEAKKAKRITKRIAARRKFREDRSKAGASRTLPRSPADEETPAAQPN